LFFKWYISFITLKKHIIKLKNNILALDNKKI
jgi:hypothetical protein